MIYLISKNETKLFEVKLSESVLCFLYLTICCDLNLQDLHEYLSNTLHIHAIHHAHKLLQFCQ